MFGFLKETFEKKTRNERAMLVYSKELLVDLGVRYRYLDSPVNLIIEDKISHTQKSNPFLSNFPHESIELDLRGTLSKSLVDAWLEHNRQLCFDIDYYEGGYSTSGTGPLTIASKEINKWLINVISMYPMNHSAYPYQEINVNDIRVLIMIVTICKFHEHYKNGLFNECKGYKDAGDIFFQLGFWVYYSNSQEWIKYTESMDYEFKNSHAYKINNEVKYFYDSHKEKIVEIDNFMKLFISSQ